MSIIIQERSEDMPMAMRMRTKLTLIVSLLLTFILAGGALITVERSVVMKYQLVTIPTEGYTLNLEL